MTNNAYITVQELKNRGWTDTLIKNLLASPDTTRKNPRYASAAPLRLYLKTRALAVEESEAWAALSQKTSPREDAAAKATQTKKDRLLAYVDSLSIHVPVVDCTRPNNVPATTTTITR